MDDGRRLLWPPTRLGSLSRPTPARYCRRRGGGHDPGRFFREAVRHRYWFALLNPPHVVQHGLSGEIAVAGPRTQRAHDERFELSRDERVEGPRRGRLIVGTFPRDALRVVPLEREEPGGHLVHHHAERVEVRSRLYWSPLDRPGDAEVGDLHAAVAVDDDVLRRDITMDDVTPVSEPERLEDLQRYRSEEVGTEGSVFQNDRLERSPLQILHSYVVCAVRLPPVADPYDVRVVEAGSAARFAAETLEELLAVRKARGKYLESDLLAENAVVGKVDIGHAAATQRADDLIAIVKYASYQDSCRLRHPMCACRAPTPKSA